MAYTPGLKIKERAIVMKTRILPVPGKVLVNEGESVNFDDIVAETELPGKPQIIDAAMSLNIEQELLPGYMVKKIGDAVNKGDVIARYTAFFGLLKKVCTSPSKGTVEFISDISGQVVIRELPVRVAVKTYIPGTVTKIIPNNGAIIETPAAFIQGIFGIGGETSGELMVFSESNDVDVGKIGSECVGKILVIKRSLDLNILRKAVEVGVKGIVSGGVDEKDLVDFMGYELGVAITGREEAGLTLIVTEGFGDVKMSEKTFQLLNKFNGKLACLNGSTQIRAGVIRPEVIIPQIGLSLKGLENYEVEDTEALSGGLMPGTPIRIISEPYFGKLGQVTALPAELQLVETGSMVRVLQAELENGEVVTVPRANVELIGTFTGISSKLSSD